MSLFGGLAATLVVGLGTPARASTPDPASIRLSGTVVPVEAQLGPDVDGPGQTLLRLADGTLTPVEGIGSLASGSTVALTAQLPAALEPTVEHAAGADALDDARAQPAIATSPVAQASADAASSRNLPLLTTSVQSVTAPARPAVRASTTAAATPAPQALTIATVSIGGYPASDYTPAVLASLVQDVSDYWSAQSNGQITFAQSGSTVSYSSSIDCSNSSALWNEGTSRTGFTDGPNKHLVLLLPRAAYDAGVCDIYGLGIVGSGTTSGGEVFVSDNSWPALAHELGHNMSLWHANELSCGTSSYDSAFDSSGEPTAAGCSVTEYGDRMDVMGASAHDDTGGLSSVGLLRLGLIPPAQSQAVTALGSTSVTLLPLSAGSAATGIRSVTVTDPRNGNVYYLENRQYGGYDQYGWGGYGNQTYGGRTTGYGLRVLKRCLNGCSALIDPTPSSSGATDTDPSVKPGSTFVSASGGIQVTTVQNSNGTVTASITLAATGTSGNTGTQSSAGTTTTVKAPVRMLIGQTYPVTGKVVATNGAVPSGTVDLTIGTDTSTVALSSTGAFSTDWTPDVAGDLEITADYAGDDSFDASSGSATSVVAAEKAAAAITVSAPAVSGSASSARVEVTVTGDDAPATGTVRITDEDGDDVGGGTLNSAGALRVYVATPQPGSHAYRAVYGGDSTIEAGSQGFTLNVGKYASKVRAALARTTITRRQSTSVTVSVPNTGDGATTGTVKLITGSGKVLDAERLSGGAARLTVPKGLPAGRQYLRVRYYGSSSVAASTSPALSLRVYR